MSSHRRATKYFSRKFNARKALFRGLIISLVEHERIKTTIVKAKEIRRHVEKAITVGKKDNLATRRLLMSRIPNETTVNKIVTDISKRFSERPGGYTRIIKIGRRPGDTAEMAFLEFVDYDWQSKVPAAGEKKAAKATKADKDAAKEKAKLVKKARALVAAKRKSVKTMQKKSRVIARG
ncbi:MAG: 50S ribosomal protein L17 [Pseudobdellovibrionaceae bacterium]